MNNFKFGLPLQKYEDWRVSEDVGERVQIGLILTFIYLS